MPMYSWVRLFLFISGSTQYTLYQSDVDRTVDSAFDCLHAYLVDHGTDGSDQYIRHYHLIPYCRRPDVGETTEPTALALHQHIARTISFAEMQSEGITHEQLLAWSAPVDVVERYEMNLNRSDVFHNCSSPWFGSLCQYRFVDDAWQPFGDIVQFTFTNRSDDERRGATGTCYRFLDGSDERERPTDILQADDQ